MALYSHARVEAFESAKRILRNSWFLQAITSWASCTRRSRTAQLRSLYIVPCMFFCIHQYMAYEQDLSRSDIKRHNHSEMRTRRHLLLLSPCCSQKMATAFKFSRASLHLSRVDGKPTDTVRKDRACTRVASTLLLL